MSLGQSVLGTALFLLVSFTIGRRLVFRLIRWTNDNFVSDVPVITTILVIMGVMALITHAIGVHTVLGAFVAGILVGRVAHPDPAHRRAAARAHRRAVHAGVLRHGGAERRSLDPEEPEPPASDARADR